MRLGLQKNRTTTIRSWATALVFLTILLLATAAAAITIDKVETGEDIFSYVQRIKGKFDQTLYCQVMGAANAYKEGDETLGVAADNETTRVYARMLLANTKVKDVHEHPLFVDGLQKLVWADVNQDQYNKVKDMTLGHLKDFLLTHSEADIKGIMEGLDSDVIACMPKLMSNAELIAIGQKVFNPLRAVLIDN